MLRHRKKDRVPTNVLHYNRPFDCFGTWKICNQEVFSGSTEDAAKESKAKSASVGKRRQYKNSVEETSENKDGGFTGSLIGTIFKLDNDYHVIWKIPQNVEHIPLFESTSFRACKGSELLLAFNVPSIFPRKIHYGLKRKNTNRLQPTNPIHGCDPVKASYIVETSENIFLFEEKSLLEFILPCTGRIKLDVTFRGSLMILRHGKAELHCQRVSKYEENPDKHSMLSAMEASPFHDLHITSSTGKKYDGHKCLFHAAFPDLDLTGDVTLFNGLAPELIDIIVHFVYRGVLPDDCCPEHLVELRLFCTQHKQLNCLVDVITKCIAHKSMTSRILALLVDLKMRLLKIAFIVNDKNDQFDSAIDETHLSNPTRFLDTLKEAIRTFLPGVLCCVELLYLYAVQSKQMDKADKNKLLMQITEKSEEASNALQTLLKVTYKHLYLLSNDELAEICKQGEPIFLKLLEELDVLYYKKCKPLLTGMVTRTNDNFKKEKVKKSGSKVFWVLKTALHTNEVSKLRDVEDKLKHAMVYFNQKREDLIVEDEHAKSDILSEIIEDDLPVYINGLSKTKYFSHIRGFRYLLKNVSSYTKWFLDIFVESEHQMIPTLAKLREIINSNEFDTTLDHLLLLPKEIASQHQNETLSQVTRSNDYQNSFPVESFLPQSIAQLYTSKIFADLQFIVCENIPENFETNELRVHQNDDQHGTKLRKDNDDANCPEDSNSSRIIKAHSAIVCVRSAWFRRALNSGMKEAQERMFRIADTAPGLFEAFVKFLYTFEVDFTTINNTGDVMELMSIADRYENEQLKEVCQCELQKNHIADESAIYIIAFAHNMGVVELKKVVLAHIKSSPKCCKCEDYAKLPKELKDEIQAEIMGKNDDGDDDDSSDNSDTWQKTPSSSSSSCASMVELDSWSSPETSPCVDSTFSNSLNNCVAVLRTILLGVPDEELVRLSLAADDDPERALNFYFQNT